MAVSGKQRAGKGGRIKVGSTVITTGLSHTMTPKIDDLDATVFEGGGYKEHLDGIVGADGSLKINWNAAQNPYDNPPYFQAGQFILNVLLWINVTDNTYWSFPRLMVVSAPVVVDVKQIVSITLSVVSDGPFYYPTGSV